MKIHELVLTPTGAARFGDQVNRRLAEIERMLGIVDSERRAITRATGPTGSGGVATLPGGEEGQVLTKDPTEPSGARWADPEGAPVPEDGRGSVAVTTRSTVGGSASGATAIGDQAAATVDGATSVGRNTSAGNDSLAAGAYARAADRAVALGSSAQADGERAVAAGPNASAAGENAVAVGSDTSAAAVGAVAIGDGAQASSPYSASFGANLNTIGRGSVQLGGVEDAAAGDLSVNERLRANVRDLEIRRQLGIDPLGDYPDNPQTGILLYDEAGALWRLSVTTGGMLQVAGYEDAATAGWGPIPSAGARDWRSIHADADGSHLVATAVNASYGVDVLVSTNGGTTWTTRTPTGFGADMFWATIGISPNGARILLRGHSGASGEMLAYSANSGTSWTTRPPLPQTVGNFGMAASDDLSVLADIQDNVIYVSTDFGATWTPRPHQDTEAPAPTTVGVSGNGQVIIVAGDMIPQQGDGASAPPVVNPFVYGSIDGGATWSTIYRHSDIDSGIPYDLYLPRVTIDTDGDTIFGPGGYGGTMSRLSPTFENVSPVGGPARVATLGVSGSGARLVAAQSAGGVYYSSDAGATWGYVAGSADVTDYDAGRVWVDVAITRSGNRLYAALRDGQIYTRAL